MKQNKLISKVMLIAIFISLVVICLAATQPYSPVIEFKPAKPKMVRHAIFTTLAAANEYVDDCVRGGYIIKSIAVSNNNTNGFRSEDVLVVAEKY